MRLWILSASTGGGHDMRAYALADWWKSLGYDAEVYHPLENAFFGYRFGCNFYNFIQRKLPLLHFAYFNFLEYASLHRDPRKIVGSKIFESACHRFSPAGIVSMHAHLNHGFFQLSRRGAGKPPFFVIFCGELADGAGFSRHWVNPAVDLFASAYEEGCAAALSRSMPPEKCLVAGPLLRRPFHEPSPAFERREYLIGLGLNPDLPVFLLGTGANGVNQHLSVVQALEKSSVSCQVVALCANNRQAFDCLQKKTFRSSLKVLPMKRIEAEEMVCLLRSADLLYGRPGAGLTTEAIVTGCPVIFDLSGGVMPQETNNLNFWRTHAKQLITCSRPQRLAGIIESCPSLPRLHIPLHSPPERLLNALQELAA